VTSGLVSELIRDENNALFLLVINSGDILLSFSSMRDENNAGLELAGVTAM
jgi:hypothetical protein